MCMLPSPSVDDQDHPPNPAESEFQRQQARIESPAARTIEPVHQPAAPGQPSQIQDPARTAASNRSFGPEPRQSFLAKRTPRRLLLDQRMLPANFLPKANCTPDSGRVRSCFHREAATWSSAAANATGVRRADSNNDREEMSRRVPAATLLRRASTSTQSRPNCLLSQPSV